jgi:hypothetical protein
MRTIFKNGILLREAEYKIEDGVLEIYNYNIGDEIEVLNLETQKRYTFTLTEENMKVDIP